MMNLYDLEQRLAQRRHEIEIELRHGDLLRQVAGQGRRPSTYRPAMRVRFGLLLIRVGARLTA